MARQKIHYCFTLSEEQVEHLRSKKYKIDRMECFMSLVTLAERETRLVPVSKTQQVEILAGQCMVDNTQLAKLWDKDRKTVPKLLEAMEALGISSSQKVGENRIHTLHSLTGWYVDGRFVKNGFHAKPNADSSENVRVVVPPARVITIETEDAAKTDTEKTAASTANSSPATEGTVSSFGGSYSTSSVQSQGNSTDAKSLVVSQPSAVQPHGNFPQSGNNHQSADSPSNPQQAHGENEGAKDSRPSWQSGGGQSQPIGNTSKGNSPDSSPAISR